MKQKICFNFYNKFAKLIVLYNKMKTSRLPKCEFNKIRNARKSEMSCHKKKNGNNNKIWLSCSRDDNGNVFCGCCQKLFFTKQELDKINELQKHEYDLKNKIDTFQSKLNQIKHSNETHIALPILINVPLITIQHDNLSNFSNHTYLSFIEGSVLTKNEVIYQLNTQIKNLEDEKNNFISVADLQLLEKADYIENTGVTNCCYNCHFRWYCENCCFTFQRTPSDRKFRTCGIGMMDRILHSDKNTRYGDLTDIEVKCLREHFKKDIKYGTHKDSLRGKSVVMSEILEKNETRIVDAQCLK